jgi:hypothetical protein
LVLTSCFLLINGNLSYYEDKIQIRQPEWIILDDATYASLEAILVKKFGYNSIIPGKDILSSLCEEDFTKELAAYFKVVATERGMLVEQPMNCPIFCYKFIQVTDKSKGNSDTYFYILTISKTQTLPIQYQRSDLLKVQIPQQCKTLNQTSVIRLGR